MIVWLASYPRSGNTLLRQIFKHCFNLDTHNCGEQASPIFSGQVEKIIGELKWDRPWSEAYAEALQSDEQFFIKTHDRPLDSSPAIYIARAGQLACYSYYRFHQKYHPEAKKTLADVIIGDDSFGDWSSHYAAWNTKASGPRLLLLFDDLVEATHETLQKIAAFIGYHGEIKPWENRMDRLQKLDPDFFRAGRVEWEPPAEWTSLEDALFWSFHSVTMRALGYPPAQPAREINSAQLIEKMTSLIHGKILHSRELQAICDERSAAISTLNAVCQEREAKIERMKLKIDALEKKKTRVLNKVIDKFLGVQDNPAAP